MDVLWLELAALQAAVERLARLQAAKRAVNSWDALCTLM